MKRFFYFLIFATTVALASCSEKSTDTPTSPNSAVAIKGHTYGMSSAGEYVNFYFASNFSCTMTSNVNGQYTSNPHMTYKIDGANVDIHRDYSTYWEQSARGTLLFHMVYYSGEDKLVWNGTIFKRIN